MSVVQSLMSQPDVSVVTPDTLSAFLSAAPEEAALVFTGETKKRPEAQDVAVVMRELHRIYRGTVRLGIVDGAAEDALKARFGVVVLPTVVLLRSGEVLERLPRIQDWSNYADAFATCFGAAPAIAAE